MQNEWTSPDGRIRLINADCLEVLPELGAGSVDAVVTDPPYGMPVGVAFVRTAGRVIHDGSDGFNSARNDAWLSSLACLRDGGNLAYFHARGDAPEAADIHPWHKFYLVKSAPPPTPRPCFVSAVEECTIAAKGKSKRRWFGTGYEPNAWIGLTPNRLNQSHGHPSEKPMEPIETLVRCLSDHGETVLDPYAGSFTTAIACIRTGRRFVGCEIEKKYWQIGVDRCKAEYARTVLFNEASGPPSLEMGTQLV